MRRIMSCSAGPSADDVHLLYDLQREVLSNSSFQIDLAAGAHAIDYAICSPTSVLLEVSLPGTARFAARHDTVRDDCVFCRIVFEDSDFLVIDKPFDLQVDGSRPLTLEKMIREVRSSRVHT